MMRQDVREWRAEAVRRIEADYNRSADTHLIRLDLPRYPGITLYLKDESSHPTGSLKHRLARSLFLYALCSGWIGPDTCVIEASSGSTAVSEAYFSRMLGLRFIAVVPASTAAPKLEAIRFYGGEIHPVEDPRKVYEVAHELAAQTGGHYLDQFTYAERATDWRGNNNIAESIFAQMAHEEHPVPSWIVCGAGTGGTSATIGRFIRYQRHTTRLCVADPLHSVFHRHFDAADVVALPEGCASYIEGIGRPRVEPSFLPSVIDRMLAVDDADSLGAMRALSDRLGRRVGGSTGTNLVACEALIREMASAGETGSVVTLLCDSGDRYGCTYYDDDWMAERDICWAPSAARLASFLALDR
ncbi:cysteine synthase [Sphingobium sp. 22B]|uniref:L-cysteine desulfhydrase Cds1 n=3 Tax=Sphingomonadaceae TaxID=41297 RepID=A0A292ZME2_SPHSA|nr:MULTISPECIES: PLP-dependent cysteine synthase family protein [Sphingobium]OAP30573.1 cysteine synthase [Sphingobium sp. 20006FA]KXU31626.1 cysteine synthase [Sphingobium sp. AM]KYC32959.1 cysteine synthase [Sphingobium sp. 22B]QDC39529.1 PLP-dependent cysteine synthase family protein [Sphingobium fuliginis ATCC 27551]RYL96862.1 PLP-dependent cysteine synthase family protein [Sphingobium fuliginis]